MYSDIRVIVILLFVQQGVEYSVHLTNKNKQSLFYFKQNYYTMYILEIMSKAHEVIPVVYEGWIPLVVAAISAASAGYGAYKKSEASKDLRNSQKDVLNRQKSLADFYNSEANRDFFDTDIGKGAVDRLTKQYKDATKKSADGVSKSGATQESKVATKSANLDKYNKALGNIAGYGANYKNNMNRSYEGVLSGIYKGNDMTYGRDVQSWGNLQNNSFNALSQTLGNVDWGDGLGDKDANPDVKKEGV